MRRRPLSGAEAQLLAVGAKAIITISTGEDNPCRERFSIAHELGHLELHRTKSDLWVCKSGHIDDGRTRSAKQPEEQEANEFAAALLLPDHLLGPLCEDTDPCLGLVAELSDTFDTSWTATAIRYMRFCEAPAALVFSEKGRIRWFERSEAFKQLGLWVKVRDSLDPSTQAATVQGMASSTRQITSVDPLAWFESGPHAQDVTIQEESWYLRSYDSVLTMLWVDEDIEEDDSYWWGQ